MPNLLEVRDLKKYFPIMGGWPKKVVGHYKAVDGVSFSIGVGDTLGLVGESGCGKTTVGKSILQLIQPTAGTIIFDGKNLGELSKEELRKTRKDIQIIFQDPYGSLNPHMTVEDIIAEPIRKHNICPKNEINKRVDELLDIVRLSSNDRYKYPHEFSGGQRQRIVIARAISVNPKLIVCDEPVSALDVSVQAQILNLMSDLKKEFGISYLFIAHGMPAVQHISDRIGVMYLGKLVETADSDDIFTNAEHPYTKALMSAIPIPDPDHNHNRIILRGEVPNLINLPEGCLFQTRCEHVCDKCRKVAPTLKEVEPGHCVACHWVDEKYGIKDGI